MDVSYLIFTEFQSMLAIFTNNAQCIMSLIQLLV